MFRLIKTFFSIILIFFIICLLIFVYSKHIEPFQLRVKEVSITSPFISEQAEGLRIIAFADTHFGDIYSTDNFEKVLNAIEENEPDIVFFLGDLIDHYDKYTDDKDIGEISRLLNKIEAPYGKYAVFGNHDYGGGAENIYADIMAAGGFKVLVNESTSIEELGIRIIGNDDVVIGYGDPTVCEESKEEQYNIVLTHAPDVADEVLEYGVDLILAGHTHGRQVNFNLSFLDNYTLPPYGRKYIKGLYEIGSVRLTKLYVNAGIGMTQLPVRFLSPPELTVITLQ
ncbi:MAG: metallophosphoesterase [Clostridiales bacterium]|nr:metallophosphoesterase [Clostridiales bacterium]